MKKRHRGQATVEFAFVGLMFFALFFGVFEVARFAFGVSTVSNAAREGARWGVAAQNVPTTPPPPPPTACDATLAGLKAAVYAQLQGITPTPTITSTQDPSAQPAWCEVTVTWDYQPVVGGLSFFNGFMLSSTSRQYYN
jgi:Flp pilus assembly protein TadG